MMTKHSYLLANGTCTISSNSLLLTAICVEQSSNTSRNLSSIVIMNCPCHQKSRNKCCTKLQKLKFLLATTQYFVRSEETLNDPHTELEGSASLIKQTLSP
jgi:hypothetical protein